MIDYNISKKVLTIGPKYTEQGGIASVVRSYIPMFGKFNFIASYVSGNILKKVFNLLLSILKLICYCTFKNIQIVHIHTASNTDFRRSAIYVRISKFFDKKVMLHIHGGKFEEYYKKNSNYVNRICNKCDSLATVSSYFVNFLNSSSLNNTVHLIPNSVKEPLAAKASDKRYCINLLYMGRIDDNKGIFTLLEVLAENKSLFNERIMLNIAGNGETERMNKYIKDNCISSLVNYHGWADEKKKAELLSSSDIYIQLSEFESFGISILEAMSYGLPIITTGAGGVTDLVEDRHNGIIVKREDKAGISEAIKYLTNNKCIREEYGKKSIAISQNYFPNKIEKRLEDIYSNMLNK